MKKSKQRRLRKLLIDQRKELVGLHNKSLRIYGKGRPMTRHYAKRLSEFDLNVPCY